MIKHRFVLPKNPLRRVQYFLSKCPVVGQNQQPLAFPVKTSNRKKPNRLEFRREQSKHRRIIPILYGAHNSIRFVHNEVSMFLGLNSLSVNAHIHVIFDAISWQKDDLAVDTDASGSDDILHFPSGAYTAHRKESVQSRPVFHGVLLLRSKSFIKSSGEITRSCVPPRPREQNAVRQPAQVRRVPPKWEVPRLKERRMFLKNDPLCDTGGANQSPFFVPLSG